MIMCSWWGVVEEGFSVRGRGPAADRLDRLPLLRGALLAGQGEGVAGDPERVGRGVQVVLQLGCREDGLGDLAGDLREDCGALDDADLGGADSDVEDLLDGAGRGLGAGHLGPPGGLLRW
jgi:hypothetical protein